MNGECNLRGHPPNRNGVIKRGLEDNSYYNSMLDPATNNNNMNEVSICGKRKWEETHAAERDTQKNAECRGKKEKDRYLYIYIEREEGRRQRGRTLERFIRNHCDY